MKKKYFNLTNKSLKELDVKNHQELWNKIGKDYEGLSREFPAEFFKKDIKGEDGSDDVSYSMILSTSDEDRHGDIVEQQWDLKWFKNNPVLLDSHNYDSIEHIIGKLKNIKVTDGKLKADIEFNMANPKGVMAKEMVDGGFINANSVGFIPKEFDDKGNILKSELLEDSLVSVPANPRALFEKKIKEVKENIKKVEEEVKETKTVVKEQVDTIDKKQATLKSIHESLKNIRKAEVNMERRAIFQTLRNL